MNTRMKSTGPTYTYAPTGDGKSFVTLDHIQASALSAPGAVVVESNSSTTKKGVRTMTIKVRVPLFTPTPECCCTSEKANNKPFAQVSLTVTLPNANGIAVAAGSAADPGSSPSDQVHANLLAIVLGLNTLLSVLKHAPESSDGITYYDTDAGAPVDGKLLLDWTEVASLHSPILRGLQGITPLEDTAYRMVMTSTAD